MPLKTRKPTGLAPWPFILIEGAEKTGKSYLPARFSADHRINETYWIDCGEGAADQYGALRGARYQIIDHDGSYRDLVNQVTAFANEVPGIDPKTNKPNVLVLDSATNLWQTLKNNAQATADRKKGSPGAQVTMDLWNKARDQWKSIVDPLIGWSGIVIFTARGKEVTAIGENGQPEKENGKVVRTYTFEAHKTLAFDVDVILRTLSPGVAMLTGARSALDITDKMDQPFTGLDLELLIFGYLQLGQAPAGTRELKKAAPETDDVPAGYLVRLAAAAGDKAACKVLWQEGVTGGFMNNDLYELIRETGDAAKPEPAKVDDVAPAADAEKAETPAELPTNPDGSVDEAKLLDKPEAAAV